MRSLIVGLLFISCAASAMNPERTKIISSCTHHIYEPDDSTYQILGSKRIIIIKALHEKSTYYYGDNAQKVTYKTEATQIDTQNEKPYTKIECTTSTKPFTTNVTKRTSSEPDPLIEAELKEKISEYQWKNKLYHHRLQQPTNATIPANSAMPTYIPFNYRMESEHTKIINSCTHHIYEPDLRYRPLKHKREIIIKAWHQKSVYYYGNNLQKVTYLTEVTQIDTENEEPYTEKLCSIFFKSRANKFTQQTYTKPDHFIAAELEKKISEYQLDNNLYHHLLHPKVDQQPITSESATSSYIAPM